MRNPEKRCQEPFLTSWKRFLAPFFLAPFFLPEDEEEDEDDR